MYPSCPKGSKQAAVQASILKDAVDDPSEDVGSLPLSATLTAQVDKAAGVIHSCMFMNGYCVNVGDLLYRD